MSDGRNRVPRSTQQFIGDVASLGNPQLEELLFKIKERVEQLSLDRDIPGQPTDLVCTVVSAGNKLTWTPAAKAVRHKIYRSVTSDFTAAILIDVKSHPDCGYYFDPAGQETASPLYYWVRGENVVYQEGPLSVMVSG